MTPAFTHKDDVRRVLFALLPLRKTLPTPDLRNACEVVARQLLWVLEHGHDGHVVALWPAVEALHDRLVTLGFALCVAESNPPGAA